MSEDGDGGPERELRSFGRKRGRKLSARQEGLQISLLPRLRPAIDRPAPARLGDLFTPPAGDVWLEIGFGGGEHLVFQARHNPGVGLIGCEPFEEGVVKVLSAIEEHELTNVLLRDDDARPLLRWLPAASISRAFILFPDPWPKRKHVKRRLVATPTLDLLARVMRPGAELRVATDIPDYVRTMLLALTRHPDFAWQAASPADWRDRPADWPQTRYEAKALREGRRGYFFRFVRR